MTFDYSTYFVACFFIPFIIVVSSLSLLISCVFDITMSTSIKDGLKSMFCITVCLFLLIISLGRLTFGGWHLIYEKENCAIGIEGIVTEITHLKRYQFPELTNEFETDHNSGYLIGVNGSLVVSPNVGSIEIGDYVSISYLPKCRYVLEINKVNNPIS